MLWVQASLCFVGWMLIGWAFARRAERLHARLARFSLGRRVGLSLVGMLGGLVALMVGLGLVALNRGLTPEGLTAWAWVALFVTGAATVLGQVLGATAMVSVLASRMKPRPETRRTDGASEPQEPNP